MENLALSCYVLITRDVAFLLCTRESKLMTGPHSGVTDCISKVHNFVVKKITLGVERLQISKYF